MTNEDRIEYKNAKFREACRSRRVWVATQLLAAGKETRLDVAIDQADKIITACYAKPLPDHLRVTPPGTEQAEGN